MTRSDLNLPEDSFLCLFIFDAHSIIARKNPWAVIEAFQQAFNEQERQQAIRLVIKVSNLNAYPEDAKRLRAAVDAVNGILIDLHLTRGETNALLNSCDVYLSLHRSEGYGLTIAEAMYLAKPVIATAYSGNMDFMTTDNSFAVPYTLVELAEDYPPYGAGNVWAEPDITAAAEILQGVYDHPEEARLRGHRAAAHLREQYNPAKIGQQVKPRLERILRNQSELK